MAQENMACSDTIVAGIQVCLAVAMITGSLLVQFSSTILVDHLEGDLTNISTTFDLF